MSEEEAKKKWCFHANSDAVPVERLPHGSTDVQKAHARCIGSACMAWRWDRDGWALTFDENGPALARKTTDAHGFCGLAGQP
jgi:hypothetical protein